MKLDVSIYKFVDEHEESEHPFADLRAELAFLAVATVDAVLGDSYEHICARAWVECVGLARRDRLIELGYSATAWVEVHVDGIADSLVPAPAGLPAFGYLLDNRSETWLLSPTYSKSERDATRLVRSRLGGRSAFPAPLHRGPAAVVRSLAYPKAN